MDALFGGAMNQTLFDNIYAAVKAYIDRYCGKTFEGASTDKYYDGNGKDYLNIDAFYGSPTVLILGINGTTEATLTEGQASDFVTAPYNSSEKNQLILSANGRYTCFPYRLRAVKVTATFGFSSSAPDDIQLAATQLVGTIATNPETMAKTQESLGDYSVSFSAVDESAKTMGINDILDSYRDIDL